MRAYRYVGGPCHGQIFIGRIYELGDVMERVDVTSQRIETYRLNDARQFVFESCKYSSSINAYYTLSA
jgi:hypothetical protein